MNTTDLNGELRERARKELDETPENVVRGLAALRAQLACLGLSSITTDEFLLRFLRARKFRVEGAIKMRYVSMKRGYPELFAVSGAVELLDTYEDQAQMMLDGHDRSGARIYVIRLGKLDLKNRGDVIRLEELFRSNILGLEWALLEERTQVAGLSVLVDMRGFSLKQHAPLLNPYYSRRTVDVVQETFPLRFKGFHVVNQPFYFDAVFALIKPFLKEKIRRRFLLHGQDMSSLHKYIDPEVLPNEYGGSGPPFDNTLWRQRVAHDLHLITEGGITSVKKKESK